MFHCLEVNPQAQNCSEKSRSKLNLKDQERIDWSLGRAGEQLQILQDSDVVIVDPPRKGLEDPFLKVLKLPGKAKKLVYISCHWNSFQRDSEALLEAGWRLQSAEGYLFFPGTNHVETLAIFERRID